MNSSPSIEVVGFPARLGECPLWHREQNNLYWVDIDGRSVQRWDPSTGAASVRNLPGRPGSVAFTADPDVLLVALEHELSWLRWSTEALIPWLELEAEGTGNRLNDGRTDPAGRLIVGSMYESTSDRRTAGLLHQIEADGTVSRLRSDIGVTNGNAFDAAGTRAYFADSFTDLVLVWDYDLATGERHNERVFFDYGPIPGSPDGACVDADGCYWSASVNGWAIVRITPDGELDRRIVVPVERPTMPCFGGPGLNTLFVTSIGGDQRTDPPPGITPAEPGSLLAIDVGDVSGIDEIPFAGAPPAA